MTDDPLRAIAAAEGVFLFREALAAGYTKNAITGMRRRGIWHRVRHGAYCFADTWAALDEAERHILLARAVRRTTPGPIAFSHTTSLLLQGVAVWGADLSRVHATRLDGGAHRTERDVVHHVGACAESDVVLRSQLPVTVPDRAVIEHATVTGTESALVSADHALHTGLTTRAALRERRDRAGNWPGSQHIHVMLHHMDGRSESVGETRSAYLFWQQGLPPPVRQFPVFDGPTLVGTTDFAWPEYGVLGEFDGKEKYLRYLRPGETPGDAVFREKQREDLLRRLTGWAFIRLVWADLHHPVRTAAYIRRALMMRARV